MRDPRRRLALIALALLATAAAPAAEAATPVTSCVQHYKGNGYLTADLDCTGEAVGVYIDGSGTLDLRGFSISNAVVGVICDGSCKVLNGTLNFNYNGAVHAIKGHAKVTNVVINAGGTDGVFAAKNVILQDVQINGAYYAFSADYGTAKLRNTQVTNGRRGGNAGKMIRLVDSSVADVQHFGLRANKIRLLRSAVTGSGTDPSCNQNISLLCGDLLSRKQPAVRESTCDTSLVLSNIISLPNPNDWDVCTAD